jgi:hypothetical protein
MKLISFFPPLHFFEGIAVVKTCNMAFVLEKIIMS